MSATKTTSIYDLQAINAANAAKDSGVVESVNAAPTGPIIIRRVKWVDLPEEYEGFKFKMWLNPPGKLWQQIFSNESDEEAKQAALGLIVMEHNSWRDYGGEVYPDTNTKEFWEAIPNELAALIITLCQLQVADLPTSALAKSRK